VAEGETFRRGGTGTGATDHHSGLKQWNKTAGTWDAWDWAGYNSGEFSLDGFHISN
jgi:hypothetical protein